MIGKILTRSATLNLMTYEVSRNLLAVCSVHAVHQYQKALKFKSDDAEFLVYRYFRLLNSVSVLNIEMTTALAAVK